MTVRVMLSVNFTLTAIDEDVADLVFVFDEEVSRSSEQPDSARIRQEVIINTRLLVFTRPP